MRARTLKNFKDTQAGVVRMAGDVFECSEERFTEINSKLKGYIEAVSEPKPKQAKWKK